MESFTDPFSECDLQDAITAARNGDSDAFAWLLQVFRSSINTAALSYFTADSDRDDLRQEATIGFYKAVRDYDQSRGCFGAFVRLCIHRNVISYVKRGTRLKQHLLNTSLSLDAPHPGKASARHKPLSAVIGARDVLFDRMEFDELLAKLIRRCSPLEAYVLRMRCDGYSFDEIAHLISVNLKTIDNAIWRVRVKARRLSQAF